MNYEVEKVILMVKGGFMMKIMENNYRKYLIFYGKNVFDSFIIFDNF